MTDVAASTSHRDALLREGLNQLFIHGYHGTTVDGLLDATGVPKGSFYHHFGDKESFVVAVLHRYDHFHQRLLEKWSSRKELSTAEMLSGYFEDLVENFVNSGFTHVDLIGKLATEIANGSESISVTLAEQFNRWRSTVEQILLDGQARGDVRTDRDVFELSATIHAYVEGAFVVAQSTRDEGALETVSAAIAESVAV
ncbi:TetR/AcrR family transcriptional regulator [Aeromicrobium sp. HA]|uniref:TetR/AcrR family transcriptional regulator n=1 Tax=Aeromicrobium sp. HA TaxID=3009077 RepID=UPI0022AF1751|nr:TetR/AcrR family transcriptional regulator [Aeromicrobium sp. HA]